MITEICQQINNHFARAPFTGELYGTEEGEYTIDNNLIATQYNYLPGQFIGISGSVLNNGIYRVKYFADGFVELEGETDSETFYGMIYDLRVPRGFVALVNRIKAFVESNEGRASNVVSSSFGIQSISFGRDANGVRAGWQATFAKELAKYRRMFSDIVL